MKTLASSSLLTSSAVRLACVSLAMLAASMSPTLGQSNLYWDTNSGSSGIQGGNGTWNTSNFWNPASDGSSTPQGWTSGDNANFSVSSSTVNLEATTWNVGRLAWTGGITVTLTNGGGLSLSGGILNNNSIAASTMNGTLTLAAAQTFNLNGSGISTISGSLNVGTYALTINSTGNNRASIVAPVTGSADITIITDQTIGVLTTNRFVQFTGNNIGFTGDFIINKGILGSEIVTTGYSANNVIQFGNTADSKEFYSYRANYTIGGLNSNGGAGLEYVSVGNHSNRTLTIDTSVTGGGWDFSGSIRELSTPDFFLVKTGAGTQTLSGNNTYTGTTTITGGTLQLGNGGTTGALLGTSAIINNATLTINRSNDFTESADLNGKAITGNGSVTQAGSGALILSGTNTYSGGTTVTGGTLVIANTSGVGSGAITQTDGTSLLKFDTSGTIANDMSAYNIAANQTVTLGGNITANNMAVDVVSGATLTVDGKISGPGGVTMNGSGTLALTAANDFSGAMTVEAGTAVLSGANTYGGGSTVSGGTLRIGGGGSSGSVTGTITTQGSGVLEFNRSDATTVSNTLAGNGTFRQIGGDTVTLDGTNTTNGTIDVTNGTVLFSGSGALPSNASLSASSNGTLSVADGTTRNSTLAGGLTMSSGAFEFDINSTASDIVNFTGAASLSGTNVVKLNLVNATSSTWTLLTAASGLDGATWQLDTDSFDTSGLAWTLSSNATALTLSAAAATNLYYWTGNTSASWGTADNWSSDSAGSSPRGAAPTTGSDLFFTADTASNISTTMGADFTVNSISITDPGVSIAAGYTLTANATSAQAFLISADSGTTTMAANLAGANAGLTKSGNGTLVLSGTNTYAGATTVNGGALSITGGSAIPTTSALVLADAAGVQVSISASNTIASLRGGGSTGGNVTIDSGQTLTVAETGTNTFSGVIGGAGSLAKSGAGTMVLDGDNTYTGATTISAGTLQIGTGGTTGSIDSTSGITNNGTLAFNRSDSLTESKVISGSGGLVKLGGATLILTANNTYSGATTISAGTLQVGNGGTSGSIGLTSGITNNGLINFNRSDSITVSSPISGSGGLTQSGSGTLVLSGSNSYNGTTALAAGTLQLGHANALGTSGNVTFTGGALVFTANGTADISSRIVSSSSAVQLDTNGQTVTFATGLAATNSGGLVKNGTGTLILTGSNAYTGGTTINAGTLQIGNGGASGSLGNYSMTNNGTLVFDTSSEVYIGPVVISGTGDLIQNGTGRLNFDHIGRYHGSGSLIINSGTVYSRRTDGLGAASSLVVNGGKFETQSNNYTVSSVSMTSGDILNIGATAISITATNGFVFEGGTVSSDIILAGGSLTKNGSGTFTLAGTNTYTGGTTLNSGTLVLTNASGAGIGTITQTDGTSLLQLDTTGTIANAMSIYNVASNQTVTISGNITAQNTTYDVATGTTLSLNGTISGGGGVTKNGNGTLELNAANTFNGTTVVNSGTLKANAANSLGSTANITVTGGSLLVTASNAIGNATEVELDGGTLAFNGTVSDSIGKLTLSANSIIDLGTGSVAASFADLAMGLYNLSIYNWTGTTLWNGGDGNNTDKVYFNRALDGSELQKISFYSDFGSSFVGTGFQLMAGTYQYEVIPVPEAETWVAAVLILGGMGIAYLRKKRRSAGGN